jgi:hypothetical protein
MSEQLALYRRREFPVGLHRQDRLFGGSLELWSGARRSGARPMWCRSGTTAHRSPSPNTVASAQVTRPGQLCARSIGPQLRSSDFGSTLRVDGFNLYYGLKSKTWHRYYWLDLNELVRSLLRPNQSLSGVKYRTARVSGPKDTVWRQSLYIDALLATGVGVIEGKYQPKALECHRISLPPSPPCCNYTRRRRLS